MHSTVYNLQWNCEPAIFIRTFLVNVLKWILNCLTHKKLAKTLGSWNVFLTSGNTTAEIKNKQMYLEGYMYQSWRIAEKRAYWVCRKYYPKKCNARAITSGPADGTPIKIKVLAESPHSHPPNEDGNIADQLATSIKRKAEDLREQLPAQLLWTELQDAPDEVLSQLTSQPVLVRAMQRICWKEVLPTSQNYGISRKYLTDTRKHCSMNKIPSPWFQSSPSIILHRKSQLRRRADKEAGPRVIVFAIWKNIKILWDSSILFVDSTFKTAPNIHSPRVSWLLV